MILRMKYDTPYVGGWGNMSCATGDTADYVFYNDYWGCQYYSMDQRSLWWKFRVDQPGFIRLAAESDATAASNFSRRLLKQVAPGDSIISINGTTDLQSWGTGTNVGVSGSPLQWYRYCIDPGVYYYHVQRCADVDTSNVRAHAYFTTITGASQPSRVTIVLMPWPEAHPLLEHIRYPFLSCAIQWVEILVKMEVTWDAFKGLMVIGPLGLNSLTQELNWRIYSSN